jgi:hypothetical protein
MTPSVFLAPFRVNMLRQARESADIRDRVAKRLFESGFVPISYKERG